MLVSVVIPAYNEEGYLPKTLDSVRKLLHPDFDVEVIVVNGSSTDRTAQVAREAGARVVTIVKDGIGRARQKGLTEAQGKIVAFTDADTIVPPDWLISHLRALRQPDIVATFGSYKVDKEGGFPFYPMLMNNRNAILKFLPALLRILYLPGQNFVFWKDKAEQVGGFDMRLKVMEDVDLGLRLRGQGKVIYVPEATVFSSGRRGKEGLGFFIRGIKTVFEYYFLSKRGKLDTFPDYR